MAKTLETIQALEQDRQAIARLYVRGYINDTVKAKAWRKLEKAIVTAEAWDELDNWQKIHARRKI